MSFLNLVSGGLQMEVTLGLAYHYALLFAGFRKRMTPANTDRRYEPRFAILIPAHNEACVIQATVSHLRAMQYPADCFDVHVVADYCEDATALEAAAAGAIVHERREGPRGRKGYALQWLFERLDAAHSPYDAAVVFDADSRPNPDFLRQMALALADGAWAVQGRHVIANPTDGIFSAIADADMRINNRIRNQAKANLGLTARLMGDAMGFRWKLLESHPWSTAQSLTEDREYGIYLATQGVRVHFAPEAVSAGQAVARWRNATPQRLRWYGGALDLQRRFLGPLLSAAWSRRNPAALDLALELTLPPFSLLSVAASALALMGLISDLKARSFPRRTRGPVALASSALLYPLLGLLLERAPAHCYKALALGPVYAVWRVAIGLRARARGGNVPWIRTQRSEERRIARES